MMHLYHEPARLVAEDGFVNVVLSYDAAKHIEDALQTALEIAPCEGGERVAVVHAAPAQMVAWEAGFHKALATLKMALAISEDTQAQNRDKTHQGEGGAS